MQDFLSMWVQQGNNLKCATMTKPLGDGAAFVGEKPGGCALSQRSGQELDILLGKNHETIHSVNSKLINSTRSF